MTQQNYIQLLSDELGYDTYKRNKNISDIIGREIRFLDSLSIKEKSLIIDEFKLRKEYKAKEKYNGFGKD